MKPFQVIVLVIFAVLAMGAVFVFATFSGSSGNAVGEVVIWGTIEEGVMRDVMNAARKDHDGYEQVAYTQLPEESFVSTLIEAIAANRGPDLILLSSSSVVNESDKLITIPYRSVSRRDFQDAFIEAGEVFLTTDGVLGLPFYIDPYVLYWNRTLFSRGGVPRAPRYWDEVSDIASVLSIHSQNGTLTQSAVALGEWTNVNHAKDIFISLIAGLGNPVIVRTEEGKLRSTLSENSGEGTSPAESSLRFYTEFADPVKSVYSWNRSQPQSSQAFLAGSLAMYLGRASEVFDIRASNPNLNFDIAPYPEVRGGQVATPASLYAFAIPRGSTNTDGALQVAILFTGQDVQRKLVEATSLPSVRRDVLSVSPENPYEATFRDAALNAFVFRDPNPIETDKIFERMIEGVSSGKLRISEAVRSGQTELNALLGVVQ